MHVLTDKEVPTSNKAHLTLDEADGPSSRDPMFGLVRFNRRSEDTTRDENTARRPEASPEDPKGSH